MVEAAEAAGRDADSRHHHDAEVGLLAPPHGVNAGTPKAVDLGQFAKALATHYDGTNDAARREHVRGLERAEPQPRPRSARARPSTAAMVNAVATGVHAVDPANLVVAGELDPFGHPKSKRQKWYSVSPLAFMRSLLCLSKGAHPHATCSTTVHFDVWAHHPYTFGGGFGKATNTDDVELGDLPKMQDVAAGGRAARTTSSRRNRCSSGSRSSAGTRSRRGACRAGRSRRPAGRPSRCTRCGGPGSPSSRGSSSRTIGHEPVPERPLLPRVVARRARPKPLLTAFRFPFVAYLHGSDGERLGTRRDERQAASSRSSFATGSGSWRTAASVVANGSGIFRADAQADGVEEGLAARVAPGSGKSLAFSLTVPSRTATSAPGATEPISAASVAAVIVAVVLFWGSLAALAWTHALYPSRSRSLRASRTRRVALDDAYLPSVAVIVTAYNEEDAIERRIENLRALDYPPELLEIVVTSDASTDRTEELAAAAGARVIRNPRGGKVAAQDAAVRATDAEIVAFSDANATWAPDALRKLVRNFADPQVAYVCGRLRLEAPDGSNKEGVYWRYELVTRDGESRLGSVTGGNGSIYALRRVGLRRGRPALRARPLAAVPHGRSAGGAPSTSPRRSPSSGRRRRTRASTGARCGCSSTAWLIVLRGRMLRGQPPGYLLALVSHRHLRYASGLLHLLLLASSHRAARPRRGLRGRPRPPARPARGGSRRASGSRATTSSSRGRRSSRSGTTCGAACPRRGRRSGRSSREPRRRRRDRRRGARSSPRRSSRSPRSRSSSRTAARFSTGRRASAGTVPTSSCSSCGRWSSAPRRWARASRSTAATPASRAPDGSCASSRSTSCRSSGTSSAAR